MLDLLEVHFDEVLVDNKTGGGLPDFVWSIHGNSIMASLKTLGKEEGELRNTALATTISTAVREQFKLLAEKNYPDGRNYVNYMYFVVKRLPRV